MKQKKKKPKSISTLKAKAWKLFSLYVRQKSADFRGAAKCYTCNNADHWKYMQAGHGIGGRHGAVLFDESIVRTQCAQCNIFKHGNYPVFVTKLIRENGLDWWEQKLAESRQIRKYTRGDYEALIESLQIQIEGLSSVPRCVPRETGRAA